MFTLIRNLFAYRVAKPAPRDGFFTRLLRLGVAHRASRARGLSGLLAKTRISGNAAKLGFGTVLAVTAAVVGGRQVRRRMLAAKHHASSLDHDYPDYPTA